jgi:uncharacterized membrane protein YdjX (TVP38/TMEM64 family)
LFARVVAMLRLRLRLCIVIAIFLSSFVLGFLYFKEIRAQLETLSKSVDTSDPSWAVVFFLLVVTTHCPIMIGGAGLLVNTTIAYIYGWKGFPITYCGSACGAILWFQVSRSIGQHYHYSLASATKTFPDYELQIRAMGRALAHNSFRATLLLQLGVFPFGLLTAFLSLTPIKISRYIPATLLSRFKLLNLYMITTAAHSFSKAPAADEIGQPMYYTRLAVTRDP